MASVEHFLISWEISGEEGQCWLNKNSEQAKTQALGSPLELEPQQRQRSSTVHTEKSLPHAKSKDSQSMLGARAFKRPLSSHLSASALGSITSTTGHGVLGHAHSLEPTPAKEMCLRNVTVLFRLELLFAFPERFTKGQLREPVPHNPSLGGRVQTLPHSIAHFPGKQA